MSTFDLYNQKFVNNDKFILEIFLLIVDWIVYFSADLIEDVKDPIIGRYRLVSSEGFDDFLRALGVGLVKRKLANSVSPIIVINVDKDGNIGHSNGTFWHFLPPPLNVCF
jgi:hypothetical protein